jgi:hypothetical protein
LKSIHPGDFGLATTDMTLGQLQIEPPKGFKATTTLGELPETEKGKKFLKEREQSVWYGANSIVSKAQKAAEVAAKKAGLVTPAPVKPVAPSPTPKPAPVKPPPPAPVKSVAPSPTPKPAPVKPPPPAPVKPVAPSPTPKPAPVKPPPPPAPSKPAIVQATATKPTTTPAKPVASPSTGKYHPIDPHAHIKDRIAASPARQRVDELSRAHSASISAQADYVAAHSQLSKFVRENPNAEPGSEIAAQRDSLEKALRAAKDHAEQASKQARAKLDALTNLPKGDRIAWKHTEKGDFSGVLSTRRAKGVDWVESKVAQVGHAYPTSIGWKAKAGARPEAARLGSKITLSHDSPVSDVIHEFGHQLEYQLPGVAQAAQDFLQHRCGSQSPRRLKDVFPRAGYDETEIGRDDDFGKAFGKQDAFYVGKHYADGSTEIISMGLEKLYKDPVKFAQDDPEYCAFLVGILEGSLRKP